MLVHLGAPVSHAVNTNDASVRADAWTSFGPCLVLLGAPSWHNISTIAALDRQGASDSEPSYIDDLSKHQARHKLVL